VLGVWAAVRPVQGTIGWLLNSIGEPGLMAKVSLLALVPMIPALFIAADLGGITAVAWVMLADSLLSALVLGYFAHSRAGIAMQSQLGALRPVLLTSPPAWLASRIAAEAAEGLPSGAALAIAVGAGVTIFALAIRLIEPGAIRSATAQVIGTLTAASRGAGEEPDPATGSGG
jgi:hypothetical protein